MRGNGTRPRGGATRFRGYDLDKLQLSTRDFVCKACSNLCDMKEFVIEGQKSFWGDKCSDKFRKPSTTGRKPVIEDLFALREQLLDTLPRPPDPQPPIPLTVGLPRAMSMIDQLPFWRGYFAELGIRTVLSPVTDPRISAAGIELAVAQPCYPVQVAHGHVQALMEAGVDYVLVPNMADAEARRGIAARRTTAPGTRRCRGCCGRRPRSSRTSTVSSFRPCISSSGRRRSRRRWPRPCARLGVTRRASDRAVDAAYRAQREFQNQLLEAGRRALAVLDETGEPGLVLAGRGYNIYDRGVNCDIPRKLRHRYGANVIPLDFLVTGREPIGDLHDNMFWISGRKILEAARVAAGQPQPAHDLHHEFQVRAGFAISSTSPARPPERRC